jgi:hypothetical protein
MKMQGGQNICMNEKCGEYLVGKKEGSPLADALAKKGPKDANL